MVYAQDHSELVPSYVTLPEVQKDTTLAADLAQILQKWRPVIRMIEDTFEQAGVEGLSGGLSIYNNIKAAAKNGVPGSQAIYDDLKTMFPGGKHKPENTGGGTKVGV